MLEPPDSRRVYLNATCTIYCVVSEEDYEWAIQWRWSFTMDKRKKKYYATRMTRGAQRVQIKIYMHKAILIERMKVEPPTVKHVIGDHGNGESRDNTRGNLDWATRRQNNLTALTHPSRQRRAPVVATQTDIPF